MGEGYTDTQYLPKVLINSYEALRVKDVCGYLEVLRFPSQEFQGDSFKLVNLLGETTTVDAVSEENAMKHNWAVLMVIEQMSNLMNMFPYSN